MRVDAYNQVTQIYQSNQKRTSSVKESRKSSDVCEISQSGRDYQVAREAIKAAPNVREDRILAIRQQMASGTYNVSAEEVADKMAESYFNTTI